MNSSEEDSKELTGSGSGSNDVGVWLDKHLDRLIEATNDLWRQTGSICRKCHAMDGAMNCLLCYCPRYEWDECGGDWDWVIRKDGTWIKDCSACTIPHQKEVVKRWLKRLVSGAEACSN